MPLVGFTHPKFLGVVDFGQAPDLFESARVCPREVILALIDASDDERRGMMAGVSPSMFDPRINCKRQVLIQRFMPYVLNPLTVWAAESGRVWHKAFLRRGDETWNVEEPLPGLRHEGNPKVRRHVSGFFEYEMWPGLWVSGVPDRWSKSSVVDLKTQKYTSKEYGPRKWWDGQLNGYRFMVEGLEQTTITELGVWRIYEGSYDMDRTFKWFDVPMMERSEFDVLVEDHVRKLDTLLGQVRGIWAQEAWKTEESDSDRDARIREFIGGVDMDGKGFSFDKCNKYCSERDVCFNIKSGVGW